MKRGVPNRIDALVESIYGAALDPATWASVLDDVRIRLGASNALLFTPEVPASEGMWVGLTYSLQAANDYAEYFHERDVWYNAAHRHHWLRARSLFVSNELVAPGVYADSEIYNDHLRQFDMFHGCWSVTPGTSRDIPLSAFGFYRDERGKSFGASDLHTLRRVSGHLQRAMEIHWRLRCVRGCRGEGLALLEHVPLAVMLVAETGCVVHENRRASALLSEQDGLAMQARRLAASDTVANRALAHLLGQCVATGKGHADFSGGAMLIPRPSGKPAWQVMVTPFPIDSALPQWATRRICAAVFIADPHAYVHVPEILLQTWFGLTPAEAHVALEVANGFDTREIADRAGISWHTVRAHLKTIYEKMDVRRESQLTRKVMACPGMRASAKS